MGQKVNPIGFRLPLRKDWKSRWFARSKEKADSINKSFGELLQEDLRIREKLAALLKNASVSKVVIERFGRRIRLSIFTARPGVIITGHFDEKMDKKGAKAAPAADAKADKKGAGLDKIKDELKNIAKDEEILVDVKEVRTPEVDAALVAESIAQQLERRVAFRRAMKRAIQTAMEKGAEGVRIRISGRLGGAELARVEQYKEGKVPLHTLSANIDYGFTEAHTLAGLIGIKVWICKPENWEEINNATNAKTRRAPKGATRNARGPRNAQ
ncbi:MAG: 30S ribosomal protein S3 [Lentisphaeria bacterium]|nr:30S ribosomal protein S3 [Lentisphaeria bacterium]